MTLETFENKVNSTDAWDILCQNKYWSFLIVVESNMCIKFCYGE